MLLSGTVCRTAGVVVMFVAPSSWLAQDQTLEL
jgi:hypothetical protein